MPIAGLTTNIVALVIVILGWAIIGVAIIEESSSTAPSEPVPAQTFAELQADAGKQRHGNGSRLHTQEG